MIVIIMGYEWINFPKSNNQEVYTYFPYEMAAKSPLSFLLYFFSNKIEIVKHFVVVCVMYLTL